MAAPFEQVARSTADGEIAVTWEDLHGADPDDSGAFLAHRASYKRQRFPSLVGRVLSDGYLAAPRGTTAYEESGSEGPPGTRRVGVEVVSFCSSSPCRA